MVYMKEVDGQELLFEESEALSFQEQIKHFMKGKQKTDDKQNS